MAEGVPFVAPDGIEMGAVRVVGKHSNLCNGGRGLGRVGSRYFIRLNVVLVVTNAQKVENRQEEKEDQTSRLDSR
jgi:hypothetical protein